MITQTVNILDYKEFEQIVKEAFGRDYNFAADEEMNNDSDRYMGLVTGATIDDYDKERFVKWMKHDTSGMMSHVLLARLVQQSVLPAGNYLIRVCW